MKRKDFEREVGIDLKLVNAVIKQIGGWNEFKKRACDVVLHGAQAGVPGFIHYSDTESFFSKNRKEILQYAKDTAQEFGETLIDMITGFNCLETDADTVAEVIYNPYSEDPDRVQNALAWFVLEEVARRFDDLSYEEKYK